VNDPLGAATSNPSHKPVIDGALKLHDFAASCIR
jgi:hypothetical protein